MLVGGPDTGSRQCPVDCCHCNCSKLCDCRRQPNYDHRWPVVIDRVLSDKVNSGGRGFNVIVLDSGSMHPVSVIHADTFSTGLSGFGHTSLADYSLF